jgi:hypothetical protein
MGSGIAWNSSDDVWNGSGGAWNPSGQCLWAINRLGRMVQFRCTRARVGVWAVGPNHDGGGCGAQLVILGGLRKNNID